STLAAHIAMPHRAEGAIGEQVGSAVGGAIGTFLLPGIGSFIGALVGGLAGSLLGDLAGNDPESHGILLFDTVNHRFVPDGHSFWGDHGASGQTFASIAQYQANIVNALAAFTGAQMHGAMVSQWGGGALVEAGPRLQYLQ